MARTRLLILLDFLIFLLMGVFPLAGCGYHAAGTPTHLPADTRLMDVPVFKNDTQVYHIELTMTQAVLRELESRTAFRTTTSEEPGNADAVLRGTITGFTVYPLTYDSTTNKSSSYEITVTASVRVTDRMGRVLYENKHYVFRQQYETTEDLTSFIQEDPAALERLSREFAQDLVADITESF